MQVYDRLVANSPDAIEESTQKRDEAVRAIVSDWLGLDREKGIRPTEDLGIY
mgnify:CR=1 FL=1